LVYRRNIAATPIRWKPRRNRLREPAARWTISAPMVLPHRTDHDPLPRGALPRKALRCVTPYRWAAALRLSRRYVGGFPLAGPARAIVGRSNRVSSWPLAWVMIHRHHAAARTVGIQIALRGSVLEFWKAGVVCGVLKYAESRALGLGFRQQALYLDEGTR
jgi:hypothetical protein